MGYDKKQLKEPTKPHYGFGIKRIEPVRIITLSVSFGTPKIPHTEYITFDVVDMLYPYNAIFGRILLNTFEVVLHLAYLCLKVPAIFDVITVFGSQKEARNIEHGFAPGHKIVHFLRENTNQPELPSSKQETSVEFKKAIEAKGDFTILTLDPIVPDKTVCIGAEISPQQQAKLIQFLDKNSDIFSWSTSDLIGGQQRSNRSQIASQPKCEAQEAEASQDVRGKNRSYEG
jgi:hypothetical protein